VSLFVPTWFEPKPTIKLPFVIKIKWNSHWGKNAGKSNSAKKSMTNDQQCIEHGDGTM
jgi:hypothetical protein